MSDPQLTPPVRDPQLTPLVVALDDPAASLELVGGKGASLARMAAAGLPVPPGFHVTTAAYRRFVAEHGLLDPILAAVAAARVEEPATLEAASRQIGELFAQAPMPQAIAEAIGAAYTALGGDLPVAVRSSATAEDLPDLSFAGQQESFLNMRGQTMVLDAVKRCWASLWTARAIGYRARHAIAPEDVQLAVVVQELVPADAAGILFTANPLTGARDQLLINAAWGLGEAIVGGQVTPDTIVVDRATATISEQQINAKDLMTVRTSEGTREEPVPADRRTQPVLSPAQAAELARLGVRIEALYGQPMDIEWALEADRLFVVQARPITALPEHVPAAEAWNDSLLGDYLWTRGNVGEAVPGVMTPCTWSLMQLFTADGIGISSVGGYPLVGNIGGRSYMNISLLFTLGRAFGLSRARFDEANSQVFGHVPEGVEVPLLPLGGWQIMREMLPAAARLRWRVASNQRRLLGFLAGATERNEALRQRIEAARSPQELLELWQSELLPFFHECGQMLQAAARRDGTVIIWARRKLRGMVGEAETNALLSGLHGAADELASLGPVLGLSRLARGEIDRATFARQYGHRGPDEFEVSTPRPGEDPEWIDRQLASLRDAPIDATALLARQKAAQAAAWQRFRQRYPRHAASIRRRIDRAAEAFRYRETARSEVIRVFWALRAFVQRVGALTGQGDDLFFLRIEELLALLAGDDAALAAIPARRTAYERYRALPVYPALIRGRFDPVRWAADPQRRSDVFDERGNVPLSAAIAGFAGAAGVVEGRVRVITSADQGDQLQPGEILVAPLTNVGWTPLFPRAAAVVTDIGAPLSHAAIVARELGIPAVVGCGNATMRLHTGDLVRVDGGQGTVEVLESIAPDSLLDAVAAPAAAQNPANWTLPNPNGSYMRSSVLELLPDPLSPLFATLGLSAWTAAMRELLASLKVEMLFANEMLTTINGYGYYDMSFSRAENVKLALAVPHMLRAFPGLLRSAQQRWRAERSSYAALVERWRAADLGSTSAEALLDGVREITAAAARYYLSVQSGILPAAYMSEALFTIVYDRLLKRRDDPPALRFVLGFDSTPIRAEKSLYDLAQWVRTQPELAAALARMPGQQFAAAYREQAGSTADGAWSAFWRRLDDHLARFGHTIYDLDFAKPVLADDPLPVLETLRFFLSSQAPDPHQRQATARAARDQATQAILMGRRGLGVSLFWRLLRFAQDFAPLREDALADVGLGWPMLRRMLREIGGRLVASAAIETADDVFWLERAELQQAVAALDAGQSPADARTLVAERRQLWERQRAVTPPVALPIARGARFLGIDFTSMMPARTSQPAEDLLTGIAASPGRVTGPARVIHGPEEFEQMRQGDILVARITTPGWTPLFALASGVVTDVGGPLSHSSIVAREYHIPAVLGTGVATERMSSGQRITVDGDAGTVSLDGAAQAGSTSGRAERR